MTRRELLAKTSSRELQEWMAYAEIDPFGEERADLRAGIIASTIMNAIQAFGDGNNKKFEPQDFMPEFETRKEKKSTEELMEKVKQLNAAFGGKDERDKP